MQVALQEESPREMKNCENGQRWNNIPALALWKERNAPEYGDRGNTVSIPRRKVCHAEQKLVKVRINKFNLEKDGGSLLELRI